MSEAPPLLSAAAAGALLIVIGSAVGVGTLAGLLQRDRRRHGPIFRTMCAALDLDRSQRRLLLRIAREARLTSPAPLLISRGCFETAVRQTRAAGENAGELERIRRKVFDDAGRRIPDAPDRKGTPPPIVPLPDTLRR